MRTHNRHVRLCVHCNNCEFNEQQDQEIKSHVSAEQDRIGNQQLLCEQCSVHWNFYSPMKTCIHREHVRLKYVCLSCEFNIKIENPLTDHIGCVRFVPWLCFHWFQVHGSEVLIQLAIFEVNIQHMLTIQFLTGNSIVMSNSLFLIYNLSPWSLLPWCLYSWPVSLPSLLEPKKKCVWVWARARPQSSSALSGKLLTSQWHKDFLFVKNNNIIFEESIFPKWTFKNCLIRT